MNATCRTALSFVLLLAVTRPGFSAAKPAVSPAEVVLAGRVVDEQGSPLAGAEIQIVPSEEAGPDDTLTAHSGADGTFRIEDLAPGTLYRLVTWKPGFVPRLEDGFAPPAATHRLVLARGRTTTGRIVDAAGRAVADATVDVIQRSDYGNLLYPGGSPLETRLRQTRTGPAGAFSLPDLAPAAYELLIRRTGLAPQRIALEVPAGKGPFDAGRIETGGTVLTGRVTDPSGRALAGAIVWLRRETDQIDGRWGEAPSTRTGDDGTFEISGLPEYGEVGIDVCAAGFIPEEVTLWDVSSEPVPVVLQPGGRITGRVVDPGGEPVAGAELFTLRDGQSGGCTINDRPCDWDEDSTITDAEGRFVLESLLAEAYTLRVYGPDFLSTDVDIQIGPGETIEDLQITLKRGEELSGQVTGPDGRPFAGAAVSVTGGWPTGVTGADGRYRLTALPAGTWTIEIEADGFEPAAEELEIGAGDNRLDASLEALPPEPEPVLREVRGRVVDLERQPIAGAQVTTEGAQAMTDAAGAFSLRLLEGGSYWLWVHKAGLTASTDQVDVGGAPVTGLEIRLIPDVVVTGRVLGLEPWELSSLRVGLAWGSPFSVLADVGKDGTYRMPHLAPGRESIKAEAAGRQVEAEVRIAWGQTEAVLDIHFPPVHEVRGWVIDADGRPVPRTEVVFSQAMGRPQITSTRADGSFKIRLEDGSYEIGAFGLRDDPEMQSVEVRGGPVTGVELVVE